MGSEAGLRVLRDLKLNRARGFLLHDDRTRGNPVAMADVSNPELDQITGSQLAVITQIKQCQLTRSMPELQANANCPDLL